MDMAVGGLKEKVVGWNISRNLGKQTCADRQMLVRLFELNWLISSIYIILHSNFIRAGVQAGNKGSGYGNLSHERLIYLTTCLIGQNVEVQVKDGSLISGIFHAANAEKDFGMS